MNNGPNFGKNPLLDYSISLKARQEELIHEKIILSNHELIQRLMTIMRLQLKNDNV